MNIHDTQFLLTTEQTSNPNNVLLLYHQSNTLRSIHSIVSLLLLSFIAHTQNKVSQIEIPCELLGVKQGLSQGYVASIIQDKEGFMWFATNDGLNKYDGYKVSVYRNNPKDAFSLSDNMISSIAEDENENFWVATRNNGLFLFDKKTERFYPIILNGFNVKNGIHDMRYKNNKLFINTFDNVLLYEIENRKLNPSEANIENQVKILFNFNEQDSIANIRSYKTNTTRVFWTNTKDIWISNCDTIIHFHAKEEGQNWSTHGYNPEEFGLPNTKTEISCLFQNPINENELVAIGDKVVTITNVINGKQILKINSPNLKFNEPIELTDGNLLIGTNDSKHLILDFQKYQILPCTFKQIDFKFQVMSGYEDPRGVIWFGTNGYGILLSDRRIKSFDTKDVPGSQRLFRSEDTPRIHRFSRELDNLTGQYFGFNKITEDKNGNYWMYLNPDGAPYYKLVSFNPFTQITKQFKPSDSITSNIFLYNDNQDRLWLTHDIGSNKISINLLSKENGSVIKHYPIPANHVSKEPEYVRNFYSADNGILYLATGEGLLRFNPNAPNSHQQWKWFKHIDGDSTSLLSNSLWCICSDPLNPSTYLWIGTTSNGFSRFEVATGKCMHYSEKDGLPNNVVYGILPDKYNNLWMSTNKGLSCFNPAKKTFQNFVAEDGLQGDEFNHYDYMKLKTGELYFGGVNGYTIFKPEVVLQKQKEIPIVFTELSIANKIVDWKINPEILNEPITYAKRIILDPNQNMFTISFSTLEYRSNKKKFYKYKLEGFQKEWTEPSIKNEATFSNLSPGTYNLHVTGTNTDGAWNTKGIFIEIVVLPAWYQTWWFRTIILLLLVAIFYTFYRYRLQKHTEVLSMRNRIAADLHDEIGSTLSSISIFSEAAKKVTVGNETAAKVLNKISANATQVMETMSDIVWTINSSNDKIDNLINRIRIYAVQMSESANFELHLAENKDIPDFTLDMNRRKHVYLLFKEALNNIAKYAQCNHVWIDFETSKHQLIMRISDDGKGFDTSLSPVKASFGGNGLFNMNKRANEIGGQLSISSAVGKGTLLVLSIPLKT